MQEAIYHVVVAALILLFVLWLIYRIESRVAKHLVYKNMPYMKDSVNSFQLKLDYLTSRINSIEEKVNNLEKNKNIQALLKETK